MAGHVYKVVQLVGSSGDGLEPAIEGALARASETLQHLDWFAVKEIRGTIEDGKPGWYQVTLDVGFRVMEPADISRHD